MPVYDDQFKSKLETKYMSEPGKDRPEIYRMLFTDSELFHSNISKIEEMASVIDIECMPLLKSKLRSEQDVHLFSAFSELVIAHGLKLRDIDYEYEKKLGGLTPDFHLNFNSQGCIIEVRALVDSDELRALKHYARDLEERLSELPGNIGLNLYFTPEPNNNSNCGILERNLDKDVKTVIKWLSRPAQIRDKEIRIGSIYCKWSEGPSSREKVFVTRSWSCVSSKHNVLRAIRDC